MNLRSITLGLDNNIISDDKLQKKTSHFFNVANKYFEGIGSQVITNRICLETINNGDDFNIPHIQNTIHRVNEICNNLGLRWFCVPFSTFGNGDLRYVLELILEIIKRYPSAFVNVIVAKDREINKEGILYASKLIRNVSRLSNNGYDNFRVGVSLNCRSNSPFFPYTHHEGEPGFSISLELTKIFIEILKDNENKDLLNLRNIIIENMTPRLKQMELIANNIENTTSLKYYGMDISLAPFPGIENSIAHLIELLGVENFGGNGTLFFTSFLTDVLETLIEKSNITARGFNGVMFSLLEDSGIGKRNIYRDLSIYSLLAYSSVCGCGIDMVPIPGDTFEEEIASLILDVAGISCKLNKPLGVRLLPFPLKKENEFTDYNYDFLCNTRIMGLGTRGCKVKIFDKEILDYLSCKYVNKKRD